MSTEILSRVAAILMEKRSWVTYSINPLMRYGMGKDTAILGPAFTTNRNQWEYVDYAPAILRALSIEINLKVGNYLT